MRHFLLWTLLCLAALAQQPEVRTRILTEGHGDGVKIGDRVAISYTLKLPNGDLVDATPANKSFGLVVGSKEVIPGLSQGVLGMKRGETREIVIPPELGYGSRDLGAIAPNSTLHFQISLNYVVTAEQEDDLADKFGKDGYENRPDARNLDKPALFEYLIRDFFTRPWRYEDSPRLTWRANFGLTLLALLIALATHLGLRLRGGAQ